jgi:hypothetical protein
MNRLLELFYLVSSLATAASSNTLRGISDNQWDALNATVGGRLHSAKPFALPCFSKYNGQSVAVDDKACAQIQANYTSPTFRLASFSASMNVCELRKSE